MRDILFNEGELSDLLFAYERRLPEEIRDLDSQTLLRSSFSDFKTYFEDRYHLNVPTLRRDQAQTLAPQDTKVAVSPHESSFYYGSSALVHVAATTFIISLPFEGDPDLFKYLPNSRYMTHIEGSVTAQQSIVLKHTVREHDSSSIKAEFDRRVGMIEEYLQTQRLQVADWNARLPERIRTLLEKRKERALTAQNVAESLGFPLARRTGTTYDLPVARRRLTHMPTPGQAPFKPEPALALRQYDEILSVISSLAIAMERSPSAFASLREEYLRDHLLAILNTQFEGKATGETFNKSGKTDILIRENDRSIFIAECKIWGGPQTLADALDQLLSYASWRDSKLAVILFNRRKDFSSVLAAIPETAKRHPQFKRQVEYQAEGACRFTFGQKSDRNRDVLITVLAFDVPAVDDMVGTDPATEASEGALSPARQPATKARRR